MTDTPRPLDWTLVEYVLELAIALEGVVGEEFVMDDRLAMKWLEALAHNVRALAPADRQRFHDIGLQIAAQREADSWTARRAEHLKRVVLELVAFDGEG